MRAAVEQALLAEAVERDIGGGERVAEADGPRIRMARDDDDVARHSEG